MDDKYRRKITPEKLKEIKAFYDSCGVRNKAE